ncbi:MAG: glycosyltransferase family 8 protein [Deltaproteobacteria bacterium]|jgi:lipopolysaccharide biosynthesis glycosyltransferase|nr:glycosyltransferase family 8 protein [Candidatus Zymogenaceae bacterium]
MNILVTTDKNYLPHAHVMLVSLLENNKETPIHLFYIHCDLDDGSIATFRNAFLGTNLTVSFIQIDRKELPALDTKGYITPETYLKIFSPNLLPRTVERILYLDPDIVVRKGLGELYKTDLGECLLGAVEEYHLRTYGNTVLKIPEQYKYFNCGVILIHVEEFRRNKISGKLLSFLQKTNTPLTHNEQDVFNAVLYDKCLYLHPKWNVHTRILQEYKYISIANSQEMREAGSDPAIVHFTSVPKPWDYCCTNPFQKEYRYYLNKTPYREAKPKGRSYPNMIRKLLLKTIIYRIPRRIKDLFPLRFRAQVMDMLLRFDGEVT